LVRKNSSNLHYFTNLIPVQLPKIEFFAIIAVIKSLLTGTTNTMHKQTPFSLCLIALLIISFSTTITASEKGMWRWLDEHGNPQFSDTPPKGIEAEFIKSSAVGRGFKSSPQTSSNSTANTGNDTQTGQSEGTKLDVVGQKDPALCKQAQNNLGALTGVPKVRVTEADGSSRLLSDDEITSERDRAQKFIEIYCP
jgi:hypothetical protein